MRKADEDFDQFGEIATFETARHDDTDAALTDVLREEALLKIDAFDAHFDALTLAWHHANVATTRFFTVTKDA